jgi:hypothetical protein
MNTRFGLEGTKQFVREMGKKRYDLYIAHHPRNNFRNTIDYKMAYYNNLWYFGTNGYSGFSDMAKILPKGSAEEYDIAKCKSHYDKFVKPLISTTKYSHANNQEIESFIPERFLFVATQCEDDTVMSLKAISTGKMIENAVMVAKELDVPVVVKFHPFAKKDNRVISYIRKLQKRKFPIYVTEANIQRIFERTIATFVINSGVGFESAIRFIPTFTFGKSDYWQIAPYNQNIHSIVKKIHSGVDPNMTMGYLNEWWSHIVDMNNNPSLKIKQVVSAKLQTL